MYTIKAYITDAGGNVSAQTLYNPLMPYEGCVASAATVDVELGKAGSAKITIPKFYGADEDGNGLIHPLYESIQKMKTVIQIMDGDDELFYGRVLHEESKFDGSKEFYLEGALAFLIDRVLTPCPGYVYSDNAEVFFGHCIDTYNEQTVGVEPLKIFRLANDTRTETYTHVSSVFGATGIEFEEHEYVTVQDALYDRLIPLCGGYIKTRYIGRDANYLPIHTIDYVAPNDIDDTEPGAFHHCNQVIRFGENMLDFSEYVSAEDTATVIVPLGKMQTVEQTDTEGHKKTVDTERINISEVNAQNPGELYVRDAVAQQLYGNIWQIVVFDDIEDPQELYDTALAYVVAHKNLAVSITVNAVDLSLLDVDYQRIHVGDFVRVISHAHGYDATVQCVKAHIDLLNPQNNKYTFESVQETLSDRQNSTAGAVKTLTTAVSNTGSATSGNYTALEQRVYAVERNTAILEAPTDITTVAALFAAVPDWQERRYYLGAASYITDRPGAGTADESYGILIIRKLPQSYGNLTYHADNGIIWYTTMRGGVLQPWSKTAFDT